MTVQLILVMIGGAVGSGLRYIVSTFFSVGHDTLPWNTLLVNLLGSFLLGVIVGIPSLHSTYHREVYALLGIGLCGGFTTMSAFSMETVLLVQAGKGALACGYVLLSLTGSAGLAYTGFIAMKSLHSL